MQFASVRIAQLPEGEQQAPVGAQVVAVHSVLCPLKTPFCAEHWETVSTWHVTAPAAWMQQAPVGCGQLAVAHAVPFPWYTPPRLAHCASLTFAQYSVIGLVGGMQHAPVGTHVWLVQWVPSPLKTPFCAEHCAGVS